MPAVPVPYTDVHEAPASTGRSFCQCRWLHSLPACPSLCVSHSQFILCLFIRSLEKAAACCSSSRCDGVQHVPCFARYFSRLVSRQTERTTICTRLLCVREKKRCALDVCLSFSKSPAHVSGRLLLSLCLSHWLCSGQIFRSPGSCAHSIGLFFTACDRKQEIRKEGEHGEGQRGVQKPPVLSLVYRQDYEYSGTFQFFARVRQTRALSSLSLFSECRLIT